MPIAPSRRSILDGGPAGVGTAAAVPFLQRKSACATAPVAPSATSASLGFTGTKDAGA